METKKLFISLVTGTLFIALTSCNAGTANTNTANKNYLPVGSYIQQNGVMSAVLNGTSTPAYNYLCQSEIQYNITINSSGQRCINGACTANPLIITQSDCFKSTQNPGTLPNLPGTITSYSDSWSNCQYKEKTLTATRSVVIDANSGGDYTLICTGIVTIY